MARFFIVLCVLATAACAVEPRGEVRSASSDRDARERRAWVDSDSRMEQRSDARIRQPLGRPSGDSRGMAMAR